MGQDNNTNQSIIATAGGPPLAVAAYQEQIAAGYGALSFQPAIEAAYRVFHGRVSLARPRPAVVILMLFGSILAAVNLAMMASGADMARLIVMTGAGELAVLALLVAGYTVAGRRNLQALSVMLALTLGLVSLLAVPHVSATAVPALFAGHLVITICVYLMMGMRFWVAVPTGLYLAACFIASAYLSGADSAAITKHVIYIFFSNLVAATALYNLEHSRRRDFLEERVLESLARRDALTGLYNRQFMDETFERCWSKAADAKSPIGVAVVDIDHFKTYNDEYGHQRGDECLCAVAAALQKIADRDGNSVYRYGGEEFVILLAHISEQTVVEYGEYVCREIESLQLMHGKSTTAPVVTVSVGVAFTFPHNSRRDVAGFLQLADRSLYAAKEAGRNRSILAVGSDAHKSTGVYTSGTPFDPVAGS